MRLAIIEDSELLRAALRAALEADGLAQVVAESGLSEEAVSEVDRLGPDVVLLGMRQSNLKKSAAICRRIRDARSATRVLMLSPSAREDEVFTSILSGASGHVSMDVTQAELVDAVRLVVNGGAHFGKEVAERVIARLERSHSPLEDAPEISDLTARERTILSMVADGLNNREIAADLGIATATVRNNLTNIRAKLGLDSRTKLVRFAYEQGLSDLLTDGVSQSIAR